MANSPQDQPLIQQCPPCGYGGKNCSREEGHCAGNASVSPKSLLHLWILKLRCGCSFYHLSAGLIGTISRIHSVPGHPVERFEDHLPHRHCMHLHQHRGLTSTNAGSPPILPMAKPELTRVKSFLRSGMLCLAWSLSQSVTWLTYHDDAVVARHNMGERLRMLSCCQEGRQSKSYTESPGGSWRPFLHQNLPMKRPPRTPERLALSL